jgi:hypothetical protein
MSDLDETEIIRSIRVEMGYGIVGADNDERRHLGEMLKEQVDQLNIGTASGVTFIQNVIALMIKTNDVDTDLIRLHTLLHDLQLLDKAGISLFDYALENWGSALRCKDGACLSFRFGDGEYGAALVLVSVVNKGIMLLGILDYKAAQPPAPDVFEQRNWLIGTHPMWRGKPFVVWYTDGLGVDDMLQVGSVALRPTDPKTSLFDLMTDKLSDFVLREKMRHSLQ